MSIKIDVNNVVLVSWSLESKPNIKQIFPIMNDYTNENMIILINRMQ